MKNLGAVLFFFGLIALMGAADWTDQHPEIDLSSLSSLGLPYWVVVGTLIGVGLAAFGGGALLLRR